MTLQAIKSGIFVPVPKYGSSLSFYSILIDAAGEYGACIFKSPKSGTISKVGFRIGAITQALSSLKVGLYTVDVTNGFPTDPLAAYGSMVAGTVAPSANTFHWVTLGTGATTAKGDKVALVVEWNAFQAGDSLNLNLGLIFEEAGNPIFPYVVSKLGGAWADANGEPNFAIEYSDNTIEHITGVTPYSNVSEEIVSSSSNPDRRGIRFKLPFPFRLKGFWSYYRGDGADEDFLLYDSDGITLLETYTTDKDLIKSAAGVYADFFSGAYTCAKDTYYRLVMRGTTTTSNRIYYAEVTNDGSYTTMDAAEINDIFHATTCAGAPANEAAWTNTLTRRYLMGLIIDKLDDGVGGGGGGLLIHPGMTGGLNG